MQIQPEPVGLEPEDRRGGLCEEHQSNGGDTHGPMTLAPWDELAKSCRPRRRPAPWTDGYCATRIATPAPDLHASPAVPADTRLQPRRSIAGRSRRRSRPDPRA